MKTAIVLVMAVTLSGCSSAGFVEVLEVMQADVEQGEQSCLRVTGHGKLGTGTFGSGDATITYVKRTSDEAPEC